MYSNMNRLPYKKNPIVCIIQMMLASDYIFLFAIWIYVEYKCIQIVTVNVMGEDFISW
jgi:hypothetical protein